MRRSFRALAAYTGGTMNVSDEGRAPERFSGSFVSANAFSVIGQAPVLGRDFAPEDDRPGAAAVVLLGNGVWTNRYGGDPAIIGRTIRVNDVPSIVIGVMPEGFKFPQNADLWQPLSLVPGLETQKRDARGLDVFGRLAPDVPLEQARASSSPSGNGSSRHIRTPTRTSCLRCSRSTSASTVAQSAWCSCR